jgi:hypothetical protein
VIHSPSKHTSSFLSFILADNRNRLLAGIYLLAILIKIVLFKYFYPHADYTPDTDTYILPAISNLNVDWWPVGYSKFLRLFHFLTDSETALVVFQYLFLELSMLLFYLSFSFIVKDDSYLRKIVFPFLLINPLFLYLSNYIISDSLFTALSLCWFTLLLWIIYKPSIGLLLAHGIILGLAVTVRYNAMVYPLIALVIIIMIKTKWWYKLIAILLPVLLISLFVFFTINQTYKRTGIKKFSPFGSWQLANNALYSFPYVPYDTIGVPASCKLLDKITYQVCKSPDFDLKKATPRKEAYFMWEDKSPLIVLQNLYITKWQLDNFSSRVAVAEIYDDYGAYLIKKHPAAFIKYFIAPNLLNYFSPDLEMINQNNRYKYHITLSNKTWLRESKRKDNLNAINIQDKVLFIFPILFFPLHLFLLEETLRYLYNTRKQKERASKLLLLLWSYLLINFGFSVIAAPINFRYQVLAFFIMLMFLMFLVRKNFLLVEGKE